MVLKCKFQAKSVFNLKNFHSKRKKSLCFFCLILCCKNIFPHQNSPLSRFFIFTVIHRPLLETQLEEADEMLVLVRVLFFG